MNREELKKRQERADAELFVISKAGDGFWVYSPASSGKQYLVKLSAETPQCNCADFEAHKTDPLWRCKHILAVQNQLAKGEPPAPDEDPYGAKEREAIQEEGRQPVKQEKKQPRPKKNGTSQMVIKRSVSPDGRIDSLSVEFSYPVEPTSPEEVKLRAQRTLEIQSEIVGSFLNGTGKENEAPKAKPPEDRMDNGDGTVPAQMLNVAGMNTRRGFKLFINVQVNGQTSKLFGSRKELGQYVSDAGFPNLADRIEQGVLLNIPCRVITEPSQDGRFLNIQRVLPAASTKTNEGRAPR